MDGALRNDVDDGYQPFRRAWDPLRSDIVQLLQAAYHRHTEPIYYGSNHTFLVTLDAGEAGESLGVYKPARGEYPLYDFAQGSLYRREVGSYLVDWVLGWNLVPPTVVSDGAYGTGSLQLFIEATNQSEIEVSELRRLALLDILLNNADRKAEHCLLTKTGKLWAIDHGLTFHVQPKLRTVLWHFAGTRIPFDERTDLKRLSGELKESSTGEIESLRKLITLGEWRALAHRVERLLDTGRFPDPRYKAVPYRW